MIFADWRHLGLAGLGVMLLLILGIWAGASRQLWFRIMTGTFLARLLLCIGSGSYYMFVTPPYYAGCPLGCPGRRGYPLPFARVDMVGGSQVAFLDFLLNLLMLWLLWLGASLVWRLLGVGFQWWNRSWRAKLVFILFTAVLPWAFLPRILDPAAAPPGRRRPAPGGECAAFGRVHIPHHRRLGAAPSPRGYPPHGWWRRAVNRPSAKGA